MGEPHQHDPSGDLILFDANRNNIHHNRCERTGSQPQSFHGIVVSRTNANNYINHNDSRGHATSDIKLKDATTTGNQAEGQQHRRGRLESQRSLYRLRSVGRLGHPGGFCYVSPGTMFRRLDGGAGTSLYIKETGANTNTGWVAKKMPFTADIFDDLWRDL